MPRIAYFFEHPSVSGAEGSALDALRYVEGGEFAVTAFSPSQGELADRLRALGIEVKPWSVPRSPEEEEALGISLKREGFDLLHANTLQLGRLTGRLSEKCGIPAVAHIRAFGTLSGRARENLRANRFLIAVSRAVAENLTESGIPAGRIKVVYNGVSAAPPALSGAPSVRKELGVNEESPLVAWAGQITVRKAPDVFLEAAEILGGEFEKLHFVLAGELFGAKEENVALKEKILAAARSGPLGGRLHFLGWRRNAVRIIREATVLLHTARQEPLGRVLIEALAAGTPVVATAVGGTPEVLGDRAILIPPDDPEKAAAETAELLRDSALRRRLSEDGIRRWRRLFQPDRAARELEEVWREAHRDPPPA